MIGIYGLLWEDDQIYIGQSINIKYRYKKHISSMVAGTHHNYKVLHKYRELGEPSLIIIEECKESQLDDLEILWIKEFNSTIDGLNISEGGNSGRGLFGTNSKYSKYKILKVFSMLYKTNSTYYEIEQRTGVNIGMISAISNNTSHVWLEETYPIQYSLLVNKCGTRISGNSKGSPIYNKEHPRIVDPKGIIHSITNIAEFCRNHPSLNEGDKNTLGAVLRGDRKQLKGFRVFDGTNNTEYKNRFPVSLIDNNGVIYRDIYNLVDFCKSHPVLCTNKYAPSNLSKVTSGARIQSIGFRLWNGAESSP